MKNHLTGDRWRQPFLNYSNSSRHPECPNPLGENIEKEVCHPEQSEGSPDVRDDVGSYEL